MIRIPVKSSVLRSIGYDAATETMEAEFNTGIIYQYFNVPVSTYNTIMDADSIGKAFNRERQGFQFHALTLEEQQELEQRDEVSDDTDEPRAAD